MSSAVVVSVLITKSRVDFKHLIYFPGKRYWLAVADRTQAAEYGAYAVEERAAHNAGRGIWSSRFETPAAWRAKHPREPR